MIDNSPVFMDDRDEAVHFVGHILEMWRAVIPNVNWALTVTPTKLRYVGNRSRVQCPECVFVEGFDAFKKAYLDAVQKEIVLPQEILLLDFCKQLRRVLLSDGHIWTGPTKTAAQLASI